jgi:hypothetical protein
MSTSSTIQAVQASVAPVENASGTDGSLSRWIFERVKEFVGGRVLEIANGEGIVAPVCKQHGIEMEVMEIELVDEEFEERYDALMGAYDTLIVLNAGEQIKKDKHIVSNCMQLLKQGGHLITRLPAQTALFNGLDQGFRQWKYNNLEYINKLLRKDCRILKTRYFLVDHYQQTPTIQIGKYNERVTLFNESNSNGIINGLSIIAVGQQR